MDLSSHLKTILLVILLFWIIPGAAPTQASTETYSKWIEQMKNAHKGPFSRIRWFCKEGQILSPEPFACKEYGGGVQHGEWSQLTKKLRQSGYMIGNVLASADIEALVYNDESHETLKHILLEKFLIAHDNGWIFRKAQFYRGALQVEDEAWHSRELLLKLTDISRGNDRNFLLLREAVSLLDHGTGSSAVTEVRELASALGELDPAFEYLRNKIHSSPDALDAERVREYAESKGLDSLKLGFERLAHTIEQLYQSGNFDEILKSLIKQLPQGPLKTLFIEGNELLSTHFDPETRLSTTADLLMAIRQNFSAFKNKRQKLAALDASLVLEQEAFTAGARLRAQLPYKSRRVKILWLKEVGKALYGSGPLSLRQWAAIKSTTNWLNRKKLPLSNYRTELQYLSRTLSWTERWYQFHFSKAIQKLTEIEPKTQHFIPEQLRSSLLLTYSAILDTLLVDANQQASISHSLFGEEKGVGLRMLNPGFTRGVLRTSNFAVKSLTPDGIYVLPETTEELPPVAGILTSGEGNTLSHIQILARNLGIPNIAIDSQTANQLHAFNNQAAVLAVSPGGRIMLAKDGPEWDKIFGEENSQKTTPIYPDLDKLNLATLNFFTLDQLRASDSGRIVGPKAANLAELRHHFPDNTPNGLVIPFGAFRAQLNQVMESEGKTVFRWMTEQYHLIDTLRDDPHSQQIVRDNFLRKLRQWIHQSNPGEKFKTRLRAALDKTFGKEGSYSLFVRSDTNVEDLPGFSGAGLNLTVPGVVGFDDLIDAITRVWASPFSDRAFAWRQQRMAQPEHVYVSLLLMKSIPVEKSGVMVTSDVETNQPDWITIVSNEGIGGAVAGQAAEEIKYNIRNGEFWLLAEATSPTRRVLAGKSGLKKVPVSSNAQILNNNDIFQLMNIALKLPNHFPMKNEAGHSTPADVEFGFQKGKLVLFQIRPYLQSKKAQQSQFLAQMDRGLKEHENRMIFLDDIAKE